jgi:hypothetical protein
MNVQTITPEDKIVKSRTVSQARLSSECWLVQFHGIEYCESCEFKNKLKHCGGLKIRQTGKNEKGFSVPI